MHIRRSHQSLTFRFEKSLLDQIAHKLYRYIAADQLSLLAVVGATLTAFGYLQGASSLDYLHLSNLGLVIHWLGDSLDGRVARLRNENRPNYGHYVDHILDAISLIIIIFGLNFSGLTYQSAWLWILALFLLTMIHSFLKASITGKFDLSFERIGPTEARIGLVIINLIVIATHNQLLLTSPFPVNVLDGVGIVTAIILLINFLKVVYQTLWGPKRITEDSERYKVN